MLRNQLIVNKKIRRWFSYISKSISFFVALSYNCNVFILEPGFPLFSQQQHRLAPRANFSFINAHPKKEELNTNATQNYLSFACIKRSFPIRRIIYLFGKWHFIVSSQSIPTLLLFLLLFIYLFTFALLIFHRFSYFSNVWCSRLMLDFCQKNTIRCDAMANARRDRHVKTTNMMHCSNEYINWSVKKPSYWRNRTSYVNKMNYWNFVSLNSKREPIR